MNKILNVERNDVFALLADDQHVYCFDCVQHTVSDIYYSEVYFVHDLLCNDRVVFFKIVEV